MEIISVGYPIVVILGLVMGSFAGATVWRLRARQLVEDKAAGEPVDEAALKRLKPLTKSRLKDDRSRCLHCGHELEWYDLVPLSSWISTKGKCRYCKKPIGRFEPLIELGTALSFIAVYHWWVSMNGLSMPGLLVVWLIATVMLVILFAYDQKWFLLPDTVMFPLIVLSIFIAGTNILLAPQPLTAFVSTLGAVVILAGLYFALWLASKSLWVGFGDVKLGLALGLLLSDWRLAFLTLFLANLIGTLIVLPGLLSGKMARGTQVPFGPLLIAGFAISLLYGMEIITVYEQWSSGLANSTLML